MMDVPNELGRALGERYRVERELGQGGMAAVYLAEDLKHGRQVAIKVLHPDLGAALGGERFLAEIRTTAKLQHPHILPLLDSGDAGNGLLYYVMPYVRGETLRARLERDRQLPVADAVLIAREVADALQHAHAQGIIHRDIKPENILLQDGHALVADFGIALAVQTAGGARMTQTGLSLGTPQYMSPEQAMGDRSLDARSDIYALGAVAYEMLTGEPPFTGANIQAIVAKVLTERPVALRTVRDTVPAAVESAVMEALAKLPADRPQRAAEFAERLVRSAEPVTDAGASGGAGRTTRRRGALATVATLLVGAVLGGGLVELARGSPRPERRDNTESGNSQLTFDGQAGLPTITPSGDAIAFVRSRCDQPGETGFVLVADATGHASPCRYAVVVMDSAGTRQVPILEGAREITGLRFSADGSRLIFAGALDSLRSGIFVVPRLGGASRRIAAAGTFDVRRGADTLLTVLTDSGTSRRYARVIDIESGQPGDSIPLPSKDVYALAWSPDGSRIAAVSYGVIYILRRDGTVTDSLRSVWRAHLRWDAEGKGILGFVPAPGNDDAFVRLEVGADGKVRGEPTSVMPRVQTLYRGEFDIAWRTGRLAYLGGQVTEEVWTFTLGANSSARQVANSTTFYQDPTLAPDGRTIFVTRGDALGDNLYRIRLDTAELIEEPMTAGRVSTVPFSVHVTADGKRVYYGDRSGGVLTERYIDLATGQQGAMALSRQANPRRFAIPLGTSRFAQIGGTGEVIRIEEGAGGPGRELSVPDSIRLLSLAGDSSGTLLAAVVAIGGKYLVGTTGLDRFDLTVRGTLLSAARTFRLSWGSDGSIYLAQWVVGDRAPSVYRAPAGGGGLVRVGSAPPSCVTNTIRVAFRASLGACVTMMARGDVRVVGLPELQR